MTPPHDPTHDEMGSRGRVLVIGWSTAVAMWLLVWFALLRPGLLVGDVLFAAIVTCPFLGGWIAGRFGGGRWGTGLGVGLVSGLVNLLLVGTVVASDATGAMVIAGALWSGSLLMGSAALGTAGAAMGSCGSPPVRIRHWTGAFAWVACVTVVLMIALGGVVTSMEAGLAVPDWPGTFGHNMLLYPLSEMLAADDVYVEHAHRLYGMLTGLTTIALLIHVWSTDRRVALRVLTVVVLGMVVVQGVLGGQRVTGTSLGLALVHGVLAQAVLAVLVVLAAMASRRWKYGTRADTGSSRRSSRLVLVLPAALFLQVLLGAIYRHGSPGSMHVLYTHLAWAILILLLAVLVAGRAAAATGGDPLIRRLGTMLMHTTGLQLVLGLLAMITVLRADADVPETVFEIVLATTHQTLGAILLAMSVHLAAWTRHVADGRNGR